MTVARVSGTDPEGQIVYGRSPRRSETQEEVRRQAYREQGIALEQGDEQLLSVEARDTDQSDPDAGAAAAIAANPPDGNADDDGARLRLGRLLQRGRVIPFGLL